MNFLENISVVWQRLSLVQRAMLIAILVAGGITAVFLTKWASKPDMRPLYSGVSPEDAGKITEKIAEKGIVYELRGTGNIYVPKEQVYQLRADLSKDGLPGSSSPGYKLFDKGGFSGSSPFLNGLNKIRALQDEIAMSIQLFDTISSARVHIVQPEQNPFKGNEANSTASVFLQIKPGFRIDQSTVAAITHMVASSIEGLAAANVTIVDNRGAMLSSVNDGGTSNGASKYIEHKERTEHRLAESAQQMLETVLGPGRSNVIVSVDVDMDSEETLITTYDKGVPENEEIESTNEVTSAGIDADGNPLTPDEKGTEKITTVMKIPMTTTKTVKMAGKIASISVSVVVDLTLPPPPTVEVAEGETAPPPPVATKIMSVEDVEDLIFSAIGKDMLTKENLTVKDISFVRAEIPEPVKVPAYVAYVGLVKQGSLGIMAVCALLALKVFSGKVKPGKGGAPVAQIDSGNAAVAALQAGDMREQISAAYRGDPEQVKELFTSWIEEKS